MRSSPLRRRFMVDWPTVEALIRNYATPVVGAGLILAGIFLRLLGKGVAYLILGVGIIGSLYLVLRGFGSGPNSWLPIAILAAGIPASAALALALRALTVAVEFGLFTVGWFLLLQAIPAFLSAFPALSTVTCASMWVGLFILTNTPSQWAPRRMRNSRPPCAVP